MRRGRLVGCLLVGLLLTSCTPGNNGTSGTIKIGLELPLSGEDAPDGTPAENAVDLAVTQRPIVCGASSHQDACFRLGKASFDDVVAGVHDPARGAQNIARLIDDTRVLAVVGPLHDSVARTEIPVANAAALAMVSPGTTSECLTEEPSDGHCAGLAARLRPNGGNNFFRVVTTELLEGDAAADLAFNRLGRRRAYVLNDGSAFSQWLARRFSAKFTQASGAVIDATDLGSIDPASPTSLGRRINAARSGGADVVYFPSTAPNTAGVARLTMKDLLPAVPFISADRIATDQFAKSADGNASGSYFTVVGPYASSLSSAQVMSRDYARQYGQPPGSYSLAAFDAANILIAAIGRAIDDAGGRMPTRQLVLNETAQTRDYRGAMGMTSFDPNGDTTLKLITVFEWLSPTDASGHYMEQIRVG